MNSDWVESRFTFPANFLPSRLDRAAGSNPLSAALLFSWPGPSRRGARLHTQPPIRFRGWLALPLFAHPAEQPRVRRRYPYPAGTSAAGLRQIFRNFAKIAGFISRFSPRFAIRVMGNAQMSHRAREVQEEGRNERRSKVAGRFPLLALRPSVFAFSSPLRLHLS